MLVLFSRAQALGKGGQRPQSLGGPREPRSLGAIQLGAVQRALRSFPLGVGCSITREGSSLSNLKLISARPVWFSG